MGFKQTEALGCRGPQASPWGPAQLNPKSQAHQPWGRGLALTSGAQGRAEGRLGGSGSHGVPSSMALGSPVNTGGCQASPSDGLSGLLTQAALAPEQGPSWGTFLLAFLPLLSLSHLPPSPPFPRPSSQGLEQRTLGKQQHVGPQPGAGSSWGSVHPGKTSSPSRARELALPLNKSPQRQLIATVTARTAP